VQADVRTSSVLITLFSPLSRCIYAIPRRQGRKDILITVMVCAGTRMSCEWSASTRSLKDGH